MNRWTRSKCAIDPDLSRPPSAFGKRGQIERGPDFSTCRMAEQQDGACREGAVACSALEDEGLGIPEEEISHVANRFFRGRHRSALGSGLGLAIIDACAPAAQCKPNAEKQKRSNWPSGRGFDGLLNSRLARAAS